MQQVLIVGVGGFLGAVSRYALTGWIHRRFPGFLPAGTLCVNVVGCLAIGFLMSLFLNWKPSDAGFASISSEEWKLFLITGILGSMTTFSTFGYETVELMHQSEIRFALWNIASNLVLGFAAVFAGKISGDFFFAS